MRIALLLALIGAPLAAQTPAVAPPASTTTAPAPLPPPGPGITRVTLRMAEGPIVLDLEAAKAPLSTANFLKYVDAKRFDGASIYRIVKSAPGFGFIQGGINNDPKKYFPPVAHEPTSKTGLHHTDGTISLPRLAPGSARGEFFITVGDVLSMDADPSLPGDNLGFAAFGHVVQGMDLIRAMLDLPTSPTKGVGVMKGQMLDKPLAITTARRVPAK